VAVSVDGLAMGAVAVSVAGPARGVAPVAEEMLAPDELTAPAVWDGSTGGAPDDELLILAPRT